MLKSTISNAAPLYLSDLGARAVARSGTPSDMYHLGQLLLTSLRTNKEWTLQIDANTGAQESSTSVLSRSIRCARSMSRRGLSVGDVIFLIAPHHLDQCIPVYAATYLGVIVYPLDMSLKTDEIIKALNIGNPRLIFCQREKVSDVEDALSQLNIKKDIITYNECKDQTNFADFLEEGDNGEKEDDFKASALDPKESFAFILSTGGTTGNPKATPLTHMNLALSFPYYWNHCTEFPNPTRMLLWSSLQWFSGMNLYYSSGLFPLTRIQTSEPFSVERYFQIINEYQINYMMVSPWFLRALVNEAQRTQRNLPSLRHAKMGGNNVSEEHLTMFREIAPACEVGRALGMSEGSGVIFQQYPSVPNTVGRISGLFQVKLVDPDTGKEVTEPFKNGELLLKGPSVFKGYYNNRKATEEVLTEDGWYKTGDLIYKDQYEFYYHAGRIKQLLQLPSGKTSPSEIEAVIRSHPGVAEVVVIGIQDKNLLDLPVACVIKNKEADITAQQIKELVKNKLSESKQLSGGVVFFGQFPVTVSKKINVNSLKDLVTKMNRE